MTDAGMIQLTPGVNPDVPDTKWAQARQNTMVKRLIAIGAIEELKEVPTVQEIPQSVQTLSELHITDALRMLEIMHDEEQLADWKKIEGRVRVRNAISRRIESLKTGKV